MVSDSRRHSQPACHTGRHRQVAPSSLATGALEEDGALAWRGRRHRTGRAEVVCGRVECLSRGERLHQYVIVAAGDKRKARGECVTAISNPVWGGGEDSVMVWPSGP